ncbi:MAG: DUF5666 domain-containing protein [Pseudomonadota bacterium]
MKNLSPGKSWSLALAVSAALAGCGGGGGTDVAGIGGTGYVATGSISQFGSIFVNGIEFETDGAALDLNGTPLAGQTGLQLGMVVTVEGTVNADGKTGTATSISYDASLKGPIGTVGAAVTNGTSTTRELTILGMVVVVESGATRLNGVTFDGFAQGDLLEVSGFLGADHKLYATYVEKKVASEDEVEIKGVVTAVSASSGTTSVSVRLDSGTELTVQVDATTQVEEQGTVDSSWVGKRVEVEGTLTAEGDIQAKEIQQEDDLYAGYEGEAEIEGIASSVNATDQTFTLNGVTVNYSAATFDPAGLVLASGMVVEVKGSFDASGVLVATSIELEDADEDGFPDDSSDSSDIDG